MQRKKQELVEVGGNHLLTCSFINSCEGHLLEQGHLTLKLWSPDVRPATPTSALKVLPQNQVALRTKTVSVKSSAGTSAPPHQVLILRSDNMGSGLGRVQLLRLAAEPDHLHESGRRLGGLQCWGHGVHLGSLGLRLGPSPSIACAEGI